MYVELQLLVLSATTTATTTTIVATATTVVVARLLCLSCYTCVRREVLLTVNLTVADPYLDTKNTYLSVSLSECVVDISAECVERCTTFLDHFASCHLGAAKTTADLNLDTLSTNAHCRCDSHLDSATV